MGIVNLYAYFLLVQSLSYVQLFTTSWTAACQASLSFTVSRSLLKLMSFGLVVTSNHLFLCCLLLLLSSVFPSIKVFPNGVSSLHQVAKALVLQLQHQLMLNKCSNEYSELTYCRTDWFNLVTEQQKVKHPWENWVRASLRAWAGGRVRETGQELRGRQWIQPQGRRSRARG